MTSPKKKTHKKRTSKIIDPAREARLQAQREKDAIKARKRLALRQKFTALREAKEVKKPHKLIRILSHESDEREERGKREKILRFRRAQSRYKLPKISINDSLSEIAANMDSLEKQISLKNESYETTETVADIDSKENMPSTTTITTTTTTDSTERLQVIDDTESHLSMISVDTMVLSDEQEQSMILLEVALEVADPEFYGFIPFKKFLNILTDNNVHLSLKQETYIMGALILLDEGVDYCSFIRSVRELGSTLLIDTTLSEIIQELADTAEKNAKQTITANKNTNITLNIDSDTEVNDADLERFMYEYRTRDRGLSLRHANRVTSNIPKTTKLGILIDDLMLDGAMVDFALLKTAFAMIDENPADDDLQYLIRYLCESSTDTCADGSDNGSNTNDSKSEIVDDDINNLEIDFNYFISFLQEATSTPVQNMKRIAPVIARVVKQMKIVKRAEDRRKGQLRKAKKRLEKRNTKLFDESAKSEMVNLAKEEKRLMRLRLRDEAMKRYR